MTSDQSPHIPDVELSWKFSRSSGPGGQHVNTSDTRVELRWDPGASGALDDVQRARVLAALRGRIGPDGTLRVVSSRFRSQTRNRDDAKARLEELVTRALAPARVRRSTRPTRASVERRMEAKRRRSDLKGRRRQPRLDQP